MSKFGMVSVPSYKGQLMFSLKFKNNVYCLLVVMITLSVKADEKIRASVSYISASVVYLDAGRDAGFAVGDGALDAVHQP